jgi:regulatory protein
VEVACLRYLAQREHSAAELRQKLTAKGFSEPLVVEVISKFIDSNLQSDVRFAECFIRSRIAKGYGFYRIRQELKLRGISADDLAALGEWDWDNLIKKVYAKKYGHTVPNSIEDRASRELFLRRRGFSHEQIRHLFLHLGRCNDD